jgi:hypothetical protein
MSSGHRDGPVDRRGELAFVDAPPTPVQVGVTELAVLQQLEQTALTDLELHPRDPCAQQRAGILGPEIPFSGAVPGISIAHHALHDP